MDNTFFNARRENPLVWPASLVAWHKRLISRLSNLQTASSSSVGMRAAIGSADMAEMMDGGQIARSTLTDAIGCVPNEGRFRRPKESADDFFRRRQRLYSVLGSLALKGVAFRVLPAISSLSYSELRGSSMGQQTNLI